MHRAGTPEPIPDTSLIDGLMQPAAYPHAVDTVELMETHISWLLLAGDFAYKVKKPLALDFLDFSTLALRKFYCEEEVRLNQPYAQEVYLDAVPITIVGDKPRIAGSGIPVEYAVRMRRFEQDLRLDRQLEAGALSIADMKELGHAIAVRHERAMIVPPERREHYLRLTREFMFDNFEALEGAVDTGCLDSLRDWTHRELERTERLLAQRFDDGFVRDCHGDLHLANLVRLPGGITTFDCIDFSEDLRHIDVVCDIAFLVMDLVERRRHDLAAHFLNRYLERSGDYAGIALLSLFFVYRCLVRAKVAVIRSRARDRQIDVDADLAEARAYCDMAMRQAGSREPLLVLMTGLSGSGKTRVSQELMAALPAIRVRSDIERKRLFGLGETEGSASGVASGIYAADADRKVYARLIEVARTIVLTGHHAIVDAAFLDRKDRTEALRLADECGCDAVIVQITAPDAVLRERLGSRTGDASEAGLEVLEHQFDTAEPFSESEQERSIVYENTGDIDVAALVARIKDRK